MKDLTEQSCDGRVDHVDEESDLDVNWDDVEHGFDGDASDSSSDEVDLLRNGDDRASGAWPPTLTDIAVDPFVENGGQGFASYHLLHHRSAYIKGKCTSFSGDHL